MSVRRCDELNLRTAMYNYTCGADADNVVRLLAFEQRLRFDPPNGRARPDSL